MNFLCIAFALYFVTATKADSDDPTPYMCRIRITAMTTPVMEFIRQDIFKIQFQMTDENGTQSIRPMDWVNRIWNDANTDVDLLYKTSLPYGAKFTGVEYSDQAIIRSLTDNQLSIRCSNITYLNFSDGTTIAFTHANTIRMDSIQPPKSAGRIYRSITFESKANLDCYAKSGYENPRTLEESERYVADGETFQHGCSYEGTCNNGIFTIVSKCSVYQSTATTVPVFNARECCEESLTTSNVDMAGCPKDQDGSAYEHPGPNVAVPWRIRFSRNGNSSICDGVIVEKHWLLSTKSCLEKGDFKFHLPMAESQFKNMTITNVIKVATESYIDLAMAKVNTPFVTDEWTTGIQKINLPWNEAVCKKFLETDCHLILGTEQSDQQSPSTVVAQIALDTHSPSIPYLKCIRKQQPLPILIGSGASSWYEKSNFLVGIYVGKIGTSLRDGKIVLNTLKNDSNDLGDLISICPYLEAIRREINISPD